MIGLVLATAEEAEPLLTALAAAKVADGPFETHSFPPAAGRPGGVVVISGIGTRAAAAATEHLLRRHAPAIVVNAGICGALSEGLEGGALLRITDVLDADRLLAGEGAAAIACHDGAWTALPPARLTSAEEPVFQPDRRSRLAQVADVVDMEGLAVAAACARHGVPVCVLKGVSDLAGPSGREDIRKNIERVSARLAEEVVSGLSRLAPPGGTMLARMARFIKIEHSLFSLPLLFAGAWLGAGGAWPPVDVLVLIALAGVGARALGMAMNRILDRRLDALNVRTAGRELPSGRMSLAAACGVAGAGLGTYLLACAGLGRLCLILSPVPAVPLVTYSMLKRFTSLCHFGIGVCMSLAPLGAFVAASGSLAFGGEVLLLAVFAFCWISGFDIIYGLLDIESDRAIGVRSIPAALGGARAQVVAAAVHLVAAAAVVWLWRLVGGGVLSGAALLVAIVGFAAAYWPRLPVRVRFFPTSAIVGIAASMVPLLGELG